MLELVRTNSENPDFIALVKLLDADLANRDGTDHSFYSQFNKIASIKYSVVAYLSHHAVGCGAIKEFDSTSMEVKRMYVKPEFRNHKVASQILFELELWAVELGCARCVLETGKRQPEAILFYQKAGYNIIPNYGQYEGIENSVCFEKKL